MCNALKGKILINATAVVVMTGFLAGCSIAREDMRSTYDYKAVVPGATKEAIEDQIGSPEEIETLDTGITRVTYSTSRVDEVTKQSLKYSRMGIDLFMAGTYEFIDPFAISENEMKIFTVDYGATNVALRITVRCETGSHTNESIIPPNPPYGKICDPVLKG